MRAISSSFYSSVCDVSALTNIPFPEYAFIGRSNVGKSSLINLLCNNPHLAKTSQNPGKTILINHFLVDDDNSKNKWFLVDLPGYGFARMGKKQRELLKVMIDRYLLYSPKLVNTFVLIDSRHPPLMIDLNFIRFLGENNIPFSLVFTKTDKLSKEKVNTRIETYKKTLLQDWETLPPIFLTSSLLHQGAEEILSYIVSINKSIQ